MHIEIQYMRAKQSLHNSVKFESQHLGDHLYSLTQTELSQAAFL